LVNDLEYRLRRLEYAPSGVARILELSPGQVRDLAERQRVERAHHVEQIGVAERADVRRIFELQLPQQEAAHVGTHPPLYFDPHGEPVRPPLRFLLDDVQQILGVPLVQVEIPTAGDAKRVRRLDRAAPVNEVQTPADHLLERRSEEHTSELQSRFDLVCRLLL